MEIILESLNDQSFCLALKSPTDRNHWSGRLVLIWSMHTLKHHLELLIKKKAVVILRRAVTAPHRQFKFCLVSSLHEELIERGQYSLVQRNWFSGVIGCT